jgi:hypothetical protein
VGSDQSKLWKRAYAAVLPGADENAARVQLRKLVNERFGRGNWAEINEQDWSIRSEVLPLDRIREFDRKHGRRNPRGFDGPLVAAEFRGHRYILDGTNRINKWIAEGEAVDREVLIINLASDPDET